MTLSFVILTWNSEKFIADCLISICEKCKKENISSEIIIIDNGSADRTKDIIYDLKSRIEFLVTVIEMSKNKGTTYTRNLGLKKAVGKYVCILDSDTEILDGSIQEVLERLRLDNQVGLICPRLVLPDGSIQHSVKKFPTFLHKIKKIFKVIFNVEIRDNDFYVNFPFENETEVETAISACWFFRRNLVDEIGLLDEKIFYAPEDLDYCQRVVRSGKKNIYFPSVEILHHTQQVSHKKPFSKVSMSHFWGLLYYYRKHGGWFNV